MKLNFKKELTNFDIANICKRLNIILNGIFMKDEIPNQLENGNYIMNLNNHNQDGSHWTSFIVKGRNVYYFDPFGMPEPEEELDNFTENHKSVYFSKVQVQDMHSILCGYFCIMFLYFVNKVTHGTIIEKIETFQHMFNWNDQSNNDKIVMKWFRQLKIK